MASTGHACVHSKPQFSLIWKLTRYNTILSHKLLCPLIFDPFFGSVLLQLLTLLLIISNIIIGIIIYNIINLIIIIIILIE